MILQTPDPRIPHVPVAEDVPVSRGSAAQKSKMIELAGFLGSGAEMDLEWALEYVALLLFTVEVKTRAYDM